MLLYSAVATSRSEHVRFSLTGLCLHGGIGSSDNWLPFIHRLAPWMSRT
jgi:hypothetical protein